MPLVSVCHTHSSQHAVAAALAQRIQLPLLETCDAGVALPFLLVVTGHPEFDYQLALHFPTAEDGARGVKFVEAAIASSAAGAMWTDASLEL